MMTLRINWILNIKNCFYPCYLSVESKESHEILDIRHFNSQISVDDIIKVDYFIPFLLHEHRLKA